MKDYKKIYAEHYGITWDRQKFEVHHIDGNRENNDVRNLLLLPKKLHQRWHNGGGWFDLDRYCSQMMSVGDSDQDPAVLDEIFDAIAEIRFWGLLRRLEYRRGNGELIREITEDAIKFFKRP